MDEDWCTLDRFLLVLVFMGTGDGQHLPPADGRVDNASFNEPNLFIFCRKCGDLSVYWVGLAPPRVGIGLPLK